MKIVKHLIPRDEISLPIDLCMMIDTDSDLIKFFEADFSELKILKTVGIRVDETPIDDKIADFILSNARFYHLSREGVPLLKHLQHSPYLLTYLMIKSKGVYQFHCDGFHYCSDFSNLLVTCGDVEIYNGSKNISVDDLLDIVYREIE